MVTRILVGDALTMLRTLESESVQVCVTSPPYFGLRDYGADGQIGLERTPLAFLEALWAVFDEVKRVLRPDGVCFVNIGDSYAGSGKGPTGHNGIQNAEQRQGFGSGYLRANGEWSAGGRKSKTEGTAGIPSKNLLLIPQRFAIGMQDRGWIVRSQIAWCKTSAMPESVRDRPTSAWETIWMFSKQAKYFYDADAVKVGATSFGRQRTTGIQPPKVRGYAEGTGQGKHGGDLSVNYERQTANLRNYWLLGPQPSSLEHYAGYPPELPKRCILAGTSEKGACPECGAPWARVVERETTAKDRQTGRGWQAGIAGQENWPSGTPTHSGLANSGYQRGVTTGWAPSCPHVERYCPSGCIGPITGDEAACIQCGALWQWRQPAPVPCVVLDPFLGSGTTLMVASRLGRDGIGVELNESYAKMAEGKIQRDAGTLFPEDVQVTVPRQQGLFDEMEAV